MSRREAPWVVLYLSLCMAGFLTADRNPPWACLVAWGLASVIAFWRLGRTTRWWKL